METSAPAILEIALLLLAAAGAGWGARRLGLPAVIGYLAVGLVVSPFTPGFIANRGELQLLADIGVILLLFEVGIEIDLRRLRREQRALIWIALPRPSSPRSLVSRSASLPDSACWPPRSWGSASRSRRAS